ncbi:MAG: TonB-dependent receptor plug domain-containing protein, partial [Sphingomonas sp.]|nr:TonB-dependent receptor plug domain-containing protein [Sphingomonas sp.]
MPAAAEAPMEGIVVTARRREEQLERVPVSMAAISGDALRQQNIVVANDLQFAVPGLSVTGVQGSREDPPISLRGQGQTFGGALPGVQSYFNEVPIPGSVSSLYDMESIQVLKGPQGTLFGRNTTGGAILYAPRRPQHEFEGYVAARVGNLDLREIEGAVNVPFGEKAALRLSGDILRRDGYTRDLTTGKKLDDQHRNNYRASLRLWLSEALTTDFVVQGYDIKQNGGSLVLYDAPANGLVSLFFPQYQIQQYKAQQLANGPRKTRTVPVFPQDFRRKNWFASNITTLELGGDVTAKNIIALQQTKRGFNTSYLAVPQPIQFSGYSKPGFLNPQGKLGGTRQFSEEFQLSGASEKLKWVAGLSYIEEKPAGILSDTLVTFGPPGGPFNPRLALANVVAKDYGIFAQGTYDLDAVTDGLSIT